MKQFLDTVDSIKKLGYKTQSLNIRESEDVICEWQGSLGNVSLKLNWTENLNWTEHHKGVNTLIVGKRTIIKSEYHKDLVVIKKTISPAPDFEVAVQMVKHLWEAYEYSIYAPEQ